MNEIIKIALSLVATVGIMIVMAILLIRFRDDIDYLIEEIDRKLIRREEKASGEYQSMTRIGFMFGLLALILAAWMAILTWKGAIFGVFTFLIAVGVAIFADLKGIEYINYESYSYGGTFHCERFTTQGVILFWLALFIAAGVTTQLIIGNFL